MFTKFSGARAGTVGAFVSMLLLAACGGGSSSTPADPPAPPPPPPPPTGTAPTLQLASNYTDLVAGATVGQPNSTWHNGSGDGGAINGVGCTTVETFHQHMVVSIYMNGVRQALPAQLGLTGCVYELHTHDSTGIVHLEAGSQKSFTLGQFFSVWGQTLSTSEVAGLKGQAWFYTIANEKVTPFSGDPKTIPFVDRGEIAIVVGTPPAVLDKNRMPANP